MKLKTKVSTSLKKSIRNFDILVKIKEARSDIFEEYMRGISKRQNNEKTYDLDEMQADKEKTLE